MKESLFLVVLIGSTGLAGCSWVPEVKARAAFDLQCPAEQITVTSIAVNSFGARGCGRQGTYVTTPNGQLVLNSQVDAVGPAAGATGTVKAAQ
jgi:hypothetical protein